MIVIDNVRKPRQQLDEFLALPAIEFAYDMSNVMVVMQNKKCWIHNVPQFCQAVYYEGDSPVGMAELLLDQEDTCDFYTLVTSEGVEIVQR